MQAVLAGLQKYRDTAAAAAAGAGAGEQAAQQLPAVSSGNITVKFLLSIDRRNDTAAALDTVSKRLCCEALCCPFLTDLAPTAHSTLCLKAIWLAEHAEPLLHRV